jgi:hypothetical protein
MTTAPDRMISTAHTPGPWNDDGQFIVARDPNGIHPDIYIAEIAQEDEEGRLASPKQQRANGNLIAAAPDMLEALELARDRLEVSNYAGEEDEALETIDTAIAKAKGGIT